MGIYSSQFVKGELWLKSLNGNIYSSNQILSSIYNKYTNHPVFYNELINNQIIKFDLFYDTLYIQTESGVIFEKLIVDNNGNITPFIYNDNFIPKIGTSIEYWFDESNLKVYSVEIISPIQDPVGKKFDFYIQIWETNIQNGFTVLIYKHHITLTFTSSLKNWGGDVANIEKPTICYNKDTKNYNISFIVRNKTNTFGLISMNFSNIQQFLLESLNGLLPFSNSSYTFTDENLL
jgi:hypothetical protein